MSASERIQFRCPLCDNNDGAAGFRRRPRSDNGWGSRYWIGCRKCEGSMDGPDYLALLAENLQTDAVTLLRDAPALLREAGCLDGTQSLTPTALQENSLTSDPYDHDGPARLDGEVLLESESTPADLHRLRWPAWHQDLLDNTLLHDRLGGRAVIEQYGLLWCPPGVWDTDGPAVGWPIIEHGDPVNVIRRFDGQPRYKGLYGRGHTLWPDRLLMSKKRPVVLVAGMRDACFARAAGCHCFTTTGGVTSWRVKPWAAGRRFRLAFDRGEEAAAGRLAGRLLQAKARSVCLLSLPKGFKDIAELGERAGLEAIKQLLKGPN